MDISTKKYSFIFLASFWFAVIANPLHAYLDPGTGSMVLQLLMGGVAGLLVFVKIYWRKLVSFRGIKNQNSDINEVNITGSKNTSSEE